MPVDLLVEQVGGGGVSEPVDVLLRQAMAGQRIGKGVGGRGEPAVNELARDELRAWHLLNAAGRLAKTSGLESLYYFVRIHGDASVVWVVINSLFGGIDARQDGGFLGGRRRWKKGVEPLAAPRQVLRQADGAAVGEKL